MISGRQKKINSTKEKLNMNSETEEQEITGVYDIREWLFQTESSHSHAYYAYDSLFVALKALHGSQSFFFALSVLFTSKFWMIAFMRPWCWFLQNFFFFQMVTVDSQGFTWFSLKVRKHCQILFKKMSRWAFLLECFEFLPSGLFPLVKILGGRLSYELSFHLHSDSYLFLLFACCYTSVTFFLLCLEFDAATKYLYVIMFVKSEAGILDRGFSVQQMHFTIIAMVWLAIAIRFLRNNKEIYSAVRKLEAATSQLNAALKTQSEVQKKIRKQAGKRKIVYKVEISYLLENDFFVSVKNYKFVSNELEKHFHKGPIVLVHEIMKFLFPIGPTRRIVEFWSWNKNSKIFSELSPRVVVQSCLLLETNSEHDRKCVSFLAKVKMEEITKLFSIFQAKGIKFKKVLDSPFFYPSANSFLSFPSQWRCRSSMKEKKFQSKSKKNKNEASGKNNQEGSSNAREVSKENPSNDLLFHRKWRSISFNSLPLHPYCPCITFNS